MPGIIFLELSQCQHCLSTETRNDSSQRNFYQSIHNYLFFFVKSEVSLEESCQGIILHPSLLCKHSLSVQDELLNLCTPSAAWETICDVWSQVRDGHRQDKPPKHCTILPSPYCVNLGTDCSL